MKYIGLFDEKEDIVTKEKLDAVEAAIPTKTSQLDNDSGFITSAPVTSVNTKTGAVILSATDVGAQPTITVNGIIKGDGAGNLSEQDTVVAELVDLPTVPTKVSELTNDSGYITAVQAPVQSVNNKTGAVQLNASDVGALPDTTIIPSKTSQLTNDSGFITIDDVPDAPVTSVNGKTGAVALTKNDIGLGNVDNVKQYSATNPPPYPVTSVNSKTGAVTLGKSDVGLGSVDNVRQYSASNPPPYPVKSVNGHTGAITIREVPAVTTSDNGKFLRVVSGAWAAVEIANANGGSF